MDSSSRRIRSLLYFLTDLETGLRKSGRNDAATDVHRLVARSAALTPREFVEGSREALEVVLLGQRDLPPELLDLIFDGMGMSDDILRETGEFR